MKDNMQENKIDWGLQGVKLLTCVLSGGVIYTGIIAMTDPAEDKPEEAAIATVTILTAIGTQAIRSLITACHRMSNRTEETKKFGFTKVGIIKESVNTFLSTVVTAASLAILERMVFTDDLDPDSNYFYSASVGAIGGTVNHFSNEVGNLLKNSKMFGGPRANYKSGLEFLPTSLGEDNLADYDDAVDASRTSQNSAGERSPLNP